MSELVSISKQIAKLQQQAAEIKSRDFKATVQEILEKMAAFGITVKDLQAASSSKKAGKGKKTAAAKPAKVAKPKSSRSTAPVAAKYRGPNGETWSGRGLTPKWLTTLEAEGRAKAEFLIAPEAAAA